MFEWAAGKIKRTWRDVGRRLRRWGYAAGLAVTVPWVVYRVIYGLKAVQAMASTLAVPLAAVGLASTAMIVAGWVVGFWRRTAPESTLRFCEEGGYIELVSAMGTKRYALDQIAHAHFIEPTDGPLGVLEVAAKAGSLTRVSIDAAQARDLLARTKLGPRHRAHRIQSQVTGCLGMGLAGYLLLIPSLAAGAAFLLGPIVALENFVTTANTTEGLTLLIVLGFQALMFAGALDVLRVMLQWVLGQEIHLGTDGIRWGKRPWRSLDR